MVAERERPGLHNEPHARRTRAGQDGRLDCASRSRHQQQSRGLRVREAALNLDDLTCVQSLTRRSLMSFRPVVRIITILLCSAVGSWAQNACAGKPQVMVLGTYHMANPGRDIYNMQADDVRSPKRQQELAQLTDEIG